MPSASDDVRKYIEDKFGSLDNGGPEKYLTDRGYILGRDHFWTARPSITDVRQMPDDEWMCFLFLFEEWDYGNILRVGAPDATAK